MECLNPNASVDECNISEMMGYLGIILAGVFVCSCCLSGCCFYCRWKMKKPDVGAITLKSSKTGQSQDVRFHVFERKGTAESQAVGKEKSINTLASAFSGAQKKTVVSWQLDTQSASARSLVSTGKVMLTTVGEAKKGVNRSDSQPAPMSNAPSAASSPNRRKKKEKGAKEVKPSTWRSGLEGLRRILTSGSGMTKEVYSLNEIVEYFSPSNRIWTSAVIVSSGDFGGDGPSYTLRVGRQRRHNVPTKFLRKTLLQGEPVSFFTGLETSWQDATVTSPPSSVMFGYELDLLDEKEQPSVAVAGRLRRRFRAGQKVKIYQGAFLGWADAVVLEDALENADDIPGQKLAEAERVVVSEGLSPEVQVKCHLRCDDEEEVEILEIPSGLVCYSGE